MTLLSCSACARKILRGLVVQESFGGLGETILEEALGLHAVLGCASSKGSRAERSGLLDDDITIRRVWWKGVRKSLYQGVAGATP